MELDVLIGASLVVLSIVLVPLASRIGAPLLLLFLAIGMLAGEDGPGGLDFDDFALALDIGSLALAVILFASGLATSRATLRIAWKPATLLATLGVVVTSSVVGLLTVALLGLDLKLGLLLGAVVGSTDAAATFLLLRSNGVRLPERVQATVELESALNDPTAIFLTTACVVLVDSAGRGFDASFGWLFLGQLGIGAAAGVAGGLVLDVANRHLSLEPALHAALALAGALALFAGTQLMGGSGYLAAFLCGLLVNRSLEDRPQVAHFHEGLGWLAQILMFLMLGLLVTPHSLAGEIGPGAVVAVLLIFVARPLAVALCAWPFGFERREQVFIGWVGLRGAVPIFLAIIPVVSPGPVTDRFFNVVFVVVVASLVLQGSTIGWLARRLGLTAGPAAGNPAR